MDFAVDSEAWCLVHKVINHCHVRTDDSLVAWHQIISHVTVTYLFPRFGRFVCYTRRSASECCLLPFNKLAIFPILIARRYGKQITKGYYNHGWLVCTKLKNVRTTLWTLKWKLQGSTEKFPVGTVYHIQYKVFWHFSQTSDLFWVSLIRQDR